MISGWRDALHALCLVVVGVCVVAGYSRIIDQPFWLGLYDRSFAFVPGDWVGNGLNDAALDAERTCVFVGTSVVREGIDPKIVAAQMPGTRVVNVATTGTYSAVDVLDIQANIMRQRGQKYRCIVVGLNNFYLRDFMPEAYELIVSDYASQLSVLSLFSLAGKGQVALQAPNLALKYGMPLRRHSLILQRTVRSTLANFHAKYVKRVGRSSFELFPGELQHSSQYQYTGPSIYADALIKTRRVLRDLGMEDPESFESAGSKLALNGAMQSFSEMTDRLYVVHMPLTSAYDKSEKAASAAYIAAMDGITIRRAIECDISISDEQLYFYDSSHLAESGRVQLSRDIGSIIYADMAGLSQRGTFC